MVVKFKLKEIRAIKKHGTVEQEIQIEKGGVIFIVNGKIAVNEFKTIITNIERLRIMQTKHFGKQDKLIKCPCCNTGQLSPGVHVVLEDVKRHFNNASVNINSGARCWDHHVEIYKELGKKPTLHSDHLMQGLNASNGADITVKGFTPKEVYDYLDKCPYSNILALGLYDTFVHVGLRGHKARW